MYIKLCYTVLKSVFCSLLIQVTIIDLNFRIYKLSIYKRSSRIKSSKMYVSLYDIESVFCALLIRVMIIDLNFHILIDLHVESFQAAVHV